MSHGLMAPGELPSVSLLCFVFSVFFMEIEGLGIVVSIVCYGMVSSDLF